MPELQIIGAPQSNYVWVARIACTEKDVPYTLVPVLPHSPEVDAIHPFGKIPAMRHGDVTLCESRAISFYIDHAFAGPPLAPRDPVAGARTEQWISLVNTHIDPLLVRQYLGAYFFPGTPDGEPNHAVDRRSLAEDGAAFCGARSRRRQNRPPCRRQLYACRHQPAADPVLSRQTAGKPGDAAAGAAPRRLLQAPPGAGERRRNHAAAFPGPLLVGNRGLSRRRDALHVPDLQPRNRDGRRFARRWKVRAGHWAVIDETRRRASCAGEPLHPTATATTIRMDGGKPLILDGPFAETKEQLAGYYILDCGTSTRRSGGRRRSRRLRGRRGLRRDPAVANCRREAVMAPSAEIHASAELVFRREHGRIIAGLIRLCGSFDRAEEAMQEAFAAALANWSARPAGQSRRMDHDRRLSQADRHARRERTRREKQADAGAGGHARR